jgi:tRNA wybutosine-synthesizing protein 1
MDKLSRKKAPLDALTYDNPREIVEEAIQRRKELLLGFKGNSNINQTKLQEALKPTMMTLSLTGESTLYPRISNLIVEAEKRDMKTFLVTNGTKPKVIENLNPLPFQLYVSVSAPDEQSYIRISRPLTKYGWKKMNETLELFPSLETRKVIRLTVIKGWNDKNYKGYADLIEKASPTFIEVKAYEWVGESQKRLLKEAMPSMEDVRRFAEKISELTGYRIKGEFIPSGVILLI